jgi:hypothetical protein
MDPQLIAVLLLVGVAAAYVLRQTLRTWAGSGKPGCSGGCGCARMVRREATERPLIELNVRR